LRAAAPAGRLPRRGRHRCGRWLRRRGCCRRPNGPELLLLLGVLYFFRGKRTSCECTSPFASTNSGEMSIAPRRGCSAPRSSSSSLSGPRSRIFFRSMLVLLRKTIGFRFYETAAAKRIGQKH
jgi:hypothetical protein